MPLSFLCESEPQLSSSLSPDTSHPRLDCLGLWIGMSCTWAQTHTILSLEKQACAHVKISYSNKACLKKFNDWGMELLPSAKISDLKKLTKIFRTLKKMVKKNGSKSKNAPEKLKNCCKRRMLKHPGLISSVLKSIGILM